MSDYCYHYRFSAWHVYPRSACLHLHFRRRAYTACGRRIPYCRDVLPYCGVPDGCIQFLSEYRYGRQSYFLVAHPADVIPHSLFAYSPAILWADRRMGKHAGIRSGSEPCFGDYALVAVPSIQEDEPWIETLKNSVRLFFLLFFCILSD